MKTEDIIANLPHQLRPFMVDLCKGNGKAFVEIAKWHLKDRYHSYLAGRLDVFEIENTRYVVRLEKGSSITRGGGREGITDSSFNLKFDFYLVPSISDSMISFRWAKK